MANASPIDTRPRSTLPPAYQAILAAEPDAVALLTAAGGEMVGAELVDRLLNAGHDWATCGWTIHRLVTMGRITASQLPKRQSDPRRTIGDFLVRLAAEADPAMTKESAIVLSFLIEKNPVLSTLDDVENGAHLARATAQKVIQELIDAGLASRPHGPKKGVSATAAGLALKTKLVQS
jgi:DNA-binding MarR family transcriptional regulator